MTFIHNLAKELLSMEVDLRNVVVIFPNRRPAVFLYRELSIQSAGPIFAPACHSIRDFVYSLCDYRQADTITQLFTLYQVYMKRHTSESAFSFEHFAGSGEIMLSDFNDIDNYMADADQLFSNLDEARAVEMWNPGKTELTEKEKEYLNFFRELVYYYHDFKALLHEKKLAYDGMAYRRCFEMLSNDLIKPEKGKTFIFAGLNALNSAEKGIIDFFVGRAGAKMFWDADHAYIDDENQEAGLFMREHFKRWHQNQTPKWMSDDLLTSPKRIKIIGAPLTLSQLKYTGQILGEIAAEGKVSFIDTAVIPGDETILHSLLESIPDSVPSVNVTLGYPLKLAPVFEFFQTAIKLHVRRQMKGAGNYKQLAFHYSNMIDLLKNPCLSGTGFFSNPDVTLMLSDSVLSGNRTHYRLEDVLELCTNINSCNEQDKEKLILLFSIHKTPADLALACSEICRILIERTDDDNDNERVMYFAMRDVLNLLKEYTSLALFSISFTGFEMLFSRLSSNVRIPMEGEPLDGLQIMGLLETRCLNFKNIIITNCNEGNIPASSRQLQTFIPYDIRRGFQLPLPAHKDAMFAYYFYRLLTHADQIWIIYNTEPDDLNGKEKSRFIRQLVHEFSNLSNGNWTISEEILGIDPTQVLKMGSSPLEVEKTSEIQQILQRQFEKGFSASKLLTYSECPFRYYLQSILNIKETITEISGDLDARVMGNVIHGVLRSLYDLWKGKPLDDEFFKTARHKYKQLLADQFDLEFAGGDMTSGKNLLIARISEKMILNTLIADEHDKTTIIPLENEFEIHAYCKKNDGNEVLIKGVFDRLDTRNGMFRIADYKTGMLEELKLGNKNSKDGIVPFDQINKHQFQLLFYLLLFHRSERYCGIGIENVQAGIIPLRKSVTGFHPLMNVDGTEWIPVESIHDFEQYVMQMISELMDVTVPFKRTDDNEKCTYCVYQSVCKYAEHINLSNDEE